MRRVKIAIFSAIALVLAATLLRLFLRYPREVGRMQLTPAHSVTALITHHPSFKEVLTLGFEKPEGFGLSIIISGPEVTTREFVLADINSADTEEEILPVALGSEAGLLTVTYGKFTVLVDCDKGMVMGRRGRQ